VSLDKPVSRSTWLMLSMIWLELKNRNSVLDK
jgi:hypothetical protein